MKSRLEADASAVVPVSLSSLVDPNLITKAVQLSIEISCSFDAGGKDPFQPTAAIQEQRSSVPFETVAVVDVLLSDQDGRSTGIVTDTVDCGPRPVDGFLTPKQSAPYRHAALFHDAWSVFPFSNLCLCPHACLC